MNKNTTAQGAQEIMTISEVAEYLRINKQTLYNWRTAGKGPRGCSLGGGGVRYRRADVDDWLTAQFERVS